MDDYIECADVDCPQCGADMYRQPCPVVGCADGEIDGYEYDDPLWFSPGETYHCEECHGHGSIVWCRTCGYCLNEHPAAWARVWRGTTDE